MMTTAPGIWLPGPQDRYGRCSRCGLPANSAACAEFHLKVELEILRTDITITVEISEETRAYWEPILSRGLGPANRLLMQDECRALSIWFSTRLGDFRKTQNEEGGL